ncbi:hypothetical protein D9757_007415 [Collybiopsis confluens]|uniref:Uncharacterized protein n=1 Tax=Collybiopsis confluens TaxID=2823264 RepID=A0A8H5HIJ5_9AGAR|nr:hypothetical protein D9757_007415 [Collybiopsis confluens]
MDATAQGVALLAWYGSTPATLATRSYRAFLQENNSIRLVFEHAAAGRLVELEGAITQYYPVLPHYYRNCKP